MKKKNEIKLEEKIENMQLEEFEELEEIDEQEFSLVVSENPIELLFSGKKEPIAKNIETTSFFPVMGIGYPVDTQTTKDAQYKVFIQKDGKRQILNKSYWITQIVNIESVRYLDSKNHYVYAKKDSEKESLVRNAAEIAGAKLQEGYQCLLFVEGEEFQGFAVLATFSTAISYWGSILNGAKAENSKKALIEVIDHEKNLWVYEKTNRKFLKRMQENDFEIQSLTKKDKENMINLGRIYAAQLKNFME
jgi:hypothetical protein